jgi:lipoprotein-releasing system ATP-binding protein
MNKKHGTTIIVVTHDRAFAESMPRVVSMKDGLVDADLRGDVEKRDVIPASARVAEESEVAASDP